MKVRFLALAIFMLACVPAFAVTNISTCQSLTPNTSYKLTGNVISTNTDCFIITGVTTNGWVDLDCDGYSIGYNGSGSVGARPLQVYNNTGGVVSWHNCLIITSTAQGYANATSYGPYIDHNYGNDPSRNATGASTWSWSNTYYNGKLQVATTDYFYSVGDYYYNSQLKLAGSNYGWVQGVTIDNSGLPRSTPADFDAGIRFDNSNNGHVEYTSITGYSGDYSSSGNIDDAILFYCNQAVSNPCTGTTVDHLTADKIWDAAVEWVGPWVSGYVGNGTYTNIGVAGLGCYGVHGCSLSNMLIEYNSVTGTSGGTMLVWFTGYGGSSFLNYIDFEHNSINSSTASQFGNHILAPFGTTVGNLIGHNQFGSSSAVDFSSGSGFYDDGSNYCSSAYSGVIYCN